MTDDTVTRRRLPNRRAANLIEIEHAGARYTVAAGHYENSKQIGELFVSGARSGSDLSALIDDAAVLASIALQYGAPLEVLARAIGRHGDDLPATVIGRALDCLCTRQHRDD